MSRQTGRGELALAGIASPTAPRAGSALRLLNFERCWLQQVFETLLPSQVNPVVPWGAADVPIGSFIDDLLASAPLKFVFGLRACLWLLMVSPIFTLGRFSSF